MTTGKPYVVRLEHQGFEEPLRIKIAGFSPIDGTDTTARIFYSGATRMEEHSGKYVLASVQEARDDYKAYISKNWRKQFTKICGMAVSGDPGGLVSRIYELARAHHDALPPEPEWDFYRPSGGESWDPKTLPERNFLEGAMVMSFVMRK